jgi:hypothetical protein
MLGSFFSGTLDNTSMVFPAIGGLVVIALTILIIHSYVFPKIVKNTLVNLDTLIPLETAYKRNLWRRIREKVAELIEEKGYKQLWISHTWYLRRLKKILDKDIGRLKKKW